MTAYQTFSSHVFAAMTALVLSFVAFSGTVEVPQGQLAAQNFAGDLA